MDKIVEAISPILFKDDGTAVFAVLDGGSIPGLLEKLHAVPRLEFVCLYAGEIKPELAKVAPYLVRLEPNSEFAKWVLREGWGKHWGVFVVAPADFLAMRRHLRRFLIVHTTDGKPFYFRYYDPRVLRNYLPTCDREQLEQMFGPAASYVAEADQPGVLLCFRLKSGALAVERKDLAAGAEIRR